MIRARDEHFFLFRRCTLGSYAKEILGFLLPCGADPADGARDGDALIQLFANLDQATTPDTDPEDE